MGEGATRILWDQKLSEDNEQKVTVQGDPTDGMARLSHAEDAIDTTYLAIGAALTVAGGEEQIGVIDRPRVEGGKLWVRVRLADTPAGADAFEKLASKEYAYNMKFTIQKMTETTEPKELLIVRWTPVGAEIVTRARAEE